MSDLLKRFINWLGWPGIIRDGQTYTGLGVQVSTRLSPWFTVITVNGVDVYFYRLTGKIDGVGGTPDNPNINVPMDMR